MEGMFSCCSSLKKLNSSNFVAYNANMKDMFHNCPKELEIPKIRNIDLKYYLTIISNVIIILYIIFLSIIFFIY